MSYPKSDFTLFSSDSQRVSANLEQIYTAWLDARRQLDALPVSMYWATKDNTDYLHIKNTSAENGTSIGPRKPYQAVSRDPPTGSAASTDPPPHARHP